MTVSASLKVLLSGLALFHLSNACIIDANHGTKTGDIMDAVDEALSIAEYAASRIEND